MWRKIGSFEFQYRALVRRDDRNARMLLGVGLI